MKDMYFIYKETNSKLTRYRIYILYIRYTSNSALEISYRKSFET